jgi:large subunit ribosomal protein L22
MKAISRQLRITPRKINLIARLIRNKDVNEALNILKFTPKKGAKLLFKTLNSAVCNAENNFKQERDSLYVKEVVVGKAMTLKRSVPISKGRTHPILKRSAHVIVTIGVKEGALKAKTASGKKGEKETGKTATKPTAAKPATKAAPVKKTPKVTKVKA